MIKKVLRELFLLPRAEQRALLLLSLLLILSIVVRAVVQLLPGRTPPGMELLIQETNAIMAAMEAKDSLNCGNGLSSSSSTKLQLTLSSPQTRVSTMEASPQPENSNDRSRVRIKHPPIAINRADSGQLLPLPGIGPVYAGRIIRYRELLGGYVRIDQLKEVYGLGEETIESIADLITIDQSMIRKIELDNATFTQLLRHPYLQYEDVKSLVNFRDYNGGFHSMQELRDNNLLSDSTLKKIAPYLHFGN